MHADPQRGAQHYQPVMQPLVAQPDGGLQLTDNLLEELANEAPTASPNDLVCSVPRNLEMSQPKNTTTVP